MMHPAFSFFGRDDLVALPGTVGDAKSDQIAEVADAMPTLPARTLVEGAGMGGVFGFFVGAGAAMLMTPSDARQYDKDSAAIAGGLAGLAGGVVAGGFATWFGAKTQRKVNATVLVEGKKP